MSVKVNAKHLSRGIQNFKTCIPKALEKALQVTVEAKAKEELYSRGDTGDHGELARSIYTTVNGNIGYVSSPLESAFWTEYGTGSYAIHGDGRPGWWVYVDDGTIHAQKRVIYSEERARQIAMWLSMPIEYGGAGISPSRVHVTKGTPPNPFLRPALENNIDELKRVLGEEIIRCTTTVKQ